MQIVLRKVNGIRGAAAMWKSTGSFSFGSGVPASALIPALAAMAGPFLLFLAFLIAAYVSARFGQHGAADGLVMAGVSGFGAKVKESQDTMTAKRKKMNEIFEAGGADRDFAKKEVLELTGAKDSAGVVAKIKEMNAELADLGKKHDELVEMNNIEEQNSEQIKRLKQPHFRPPLPDGGDRDDVRQSAQKSLGSIITKSGAYDTYRKNKSQPVTEQLDGEENASISMKTLMSTSAGFAPESTRISRIQEAVTRPIQVLDLIPTFPTGQAAVVYMEETTRTHNAAERNEGASYAEDAFAFTEQSETVRLIGTSLPITDEQVEDVPFIEGYASQRLVFSCRQRFDGQVLNGNGSAPNLRGINNKVGIQTQAKGADPTPDAFYKAMTKIRVTGRAFPNAIVIHPNDWQEIRLLRTADGIYIWGSPSEVGPERMWGAQVAQSDAQAEGTGLVGDFLNHCAAFERRGIEIAIGYVNAQFGEGKKTIRAGFRVTFIVFRASAFCQVTGI